MKLCDLLEVVNSDVWLKGYDADGNVIFEGTSDEVAKYEEWLIVSMWTEQDEYSSCISFHIAID